MPSSKNKKQHASSNKIIENRRAKFDYELSDKLQVGIRLDGQQVRAARDGRVSLKGSYVNIYQNELWLTNASFSIRPLYLQKSGINNEKATIIDDSPKKLLATRSQINNFISRRTDGYTIIPLQLLQYGRHIKLIIALGKGKRQYDKRATIKKREQEREIKSAYKHQY